MSLAAHRYLPERRRHVNPRGTIDFMGFSGYNRTLQKTQAAKPESIPHTGKGLP